MHLAGGGAGRAMAGAEVPPGVRQTDRMQRQNQGQMRNIYDKVSLEFKKSVPPAKKLIPRPILTENSPKSPGMDFTHPKSRFEHFWDPTQPPSW